MHRVTRGQNQAAEVNVHPARDSGLQSAVSRHQSDKGGNGMWHREPNGDLSASLDGMRLVVRKINGFARYMLLAQPRRMHDPEFLLESGSADNVDAAKEAALRRARQTLSLRLIAGRRRATRGVNR